MADVREAPRPVRWAWRLPHEGVRHHSSGWSVQHSMTPVFDRIGHLLRAERDWSFSVLLSNGQTIIVKAKGNAMFDTMLEKAAMAAQGVQVGVNEDGEAVFPGRHTGLAIARAVLMAVREPDARLHTVGRRAADQADPMNGFASSYGEAFTAMIDAILNEDPSNG